MHSLAAAAIQPFVQSEFAPLFMSPMVDEAHADGARGEVRRMRGFDPALVDKAGHGVMVGMRSRAKWPNSPNHADARSASGGSAQARSGEGLEDARRAALH